MQVTLNYLMLEWEITQIADNGRKARNIFFNDKTENYLSLFIHEYEFIIPKEIMKRYCEISATSPAPFLHGSIL